MKIKIDEEKSTVTSIALKNNILLIGSKIRGLFGIRACTEVFKIRKNLTITQITREPLLKVVDQSAGILSLSFVNQFAFVAFFKEGGVSYIKDEKNKLA